MDMLTVGVARERANGCTIRVMRMHAMAKTWNKAAGLIPDTDTERLAAISKILTDIVSSSRKLIETAQFYTSFAEQVPSRVLRERLKPQD